MTFISNCSDSVILIHVRIIGNPVVQIKGYRYTKGGKSACRAGWELTNNPDFMKLFVKKYKICVNERGNSAVHCIFLE